MIKQNIYETIGYRKDGILHLTLAEAEQVMKQGALLVDIREHYETASKKFDVDGILYLPLSKFMDEHIHLPKDKLLILACKSGQRSEKAAMFLKSKGFMSIASLIGGITEWEKTGMNLITS